MPKLSVYLPDELADRVRDAKLPVSAICQAALADALRALEVADPLVARDAVVPADLDLEGPFVRNFVDAVGLAYEHARRRGSATVESDDLLQGILDEGENLMLRTLAAIGVEPSALQAELDALDLPRVPLGEGADPSLSPRARRLVVKAAADASRVGRPLNLAHLLTALLADPDGGAGRALRAVGLDVETARQAIAAMESGFSFARTASGTLASMRIERALDELVERVGAIERTLDRSAGRSATSGTATDSHSR